MVIAGYGDCSPWLIVFHNSMAVVSYVCRCGKTDAYCTYNIHLYFILHSCILTYCICNAWLHNNIVLSLLKDNFYACWFEMHSLHEFPDHLDPWNKQHMTIGLSLLWYCLFFRRILRITVRIYTVDRSINFRPFPQKLTRNLNKIDP